jgi:predicted glycoside hydrolase/deacetylase ChbG (UPF0249 family)
VKPPDTRYLIINADDFGIRSGVNQAVETLYRQGAITSASLLAPAEEAAAAAKIAAAQGIPLGIHWTLHSEWEAPRWTPRAPAATVPSLTEDGLLLHDQKRLVREAAASEVQRELTAQLNQLRAWKIRPTHADAHGTTLYGMNGRLFIIDALKLCRKNGLPFRFPKRPGFLTRQLGRPPPPPLLAAHRAIVTLAGLLRVPLPDDFITDPRPIAAIRDRQDLAAYYLETLRRAGPGITEVFLHPSLPDPELRAKSPEWQKREWEYEFLSSGALTQCAQAEGFTLISWGDGFPASSSNGSG